MDSRELTIRDLVQLEKYALFPTDNLINRPIVVQKALEDEKGLIGAVVVNSTVELSAIFNGRSARDKIGVMKQLFDILYADLHPRGYRDLHAFVKDPKFADILVRHFNFEHASGQALVRRY